MGTMKMTEVLLDVNKKLRSKMSDIMMLLEPVNSLS